MVPILGPLVEAAGSRNTMNSKGFGSVWLQRGPPFGCWFWEVFGRVFVHVLGSFWGSFSGSIRAPVLVTPLARSCSAWARLGPGWRDA